MKTAILSGIFIFLMWRAMWKVPEPNAAFSAMRSGETYAGMIDESSVGISLIFYIQNFLDYTERRLRRDTAFRIQSVNFSGLSVSGKILLPIRKTMKQIQKAKVAARDRISLIEAAKKRR